MPKRPRNPKISFVKRRKSVGSKSFFVPKQDAVGRKGARVERHVYTYAFPKVKFGKQNGDKLANHVSNIYKKILKRYGKTADGIAYSIEGKGALDVNKRGYPEWERKSVAIHRNYMGPTKNKRDAVERTRAYGNNDFASLVQAGVFRQSKSKPVFFIPKTITISVISKPGKRLKTFNKATTEAVPTWRKKTKHATAKVRKTRHRS